LVVSEVRELWKIEYWFLLLDLIVVVIIDLNNTLPDEIHFLDVTLIADDSLAWGVKSAEHVDDQLIGESSLTFIKEVVERLLKLLENSSVLDKFSLHFWSNLLIENELFNYQVEIIHKGLLYVLSYIVIEGWLNMEWLVRFLYLLDPHIKRVKFVFD
jgi:hypothetical protein